MAERNLKNRAGSKIRLINYRLPNKMFHNLLFFKRISIIRLSLSKLIVDYYLIIDQ